MRIGVVPAMMGHGGGVHQYSLTMLHALRGSEEIRSNNEFVIFTDSTYEDITVLSKEHGWDVESLTPHYWTQRVLHLAGIILRKTRIIQIWRQLRRRSQTMRNTPHPDLIRPPLAPDLVRPRPDMRRWFHHFGVELMLYPYPNSLSFETGIPYIMAIHDLQHRLQPEFPEVSADGEWEWREYLFRNGARYATLILADSEVGKQDILNFYGQYGITSEQVQILPFLPAQYLSVAISERENRQIGMKYSLPERYLFYPSQLWPHKNHARIVQALGQLKQKEHVKIPIVLCGYHRGAILERNFREVMELSSQLGLKEEIHYVGYVPDSDMSGLYGGATALVMPTFFGPTNIPILEAWAFGCPVITSDIRGIREQVGDAAVLVDPRSVESIADAIHRLWVDGNLRSTLADKGRRRLSEYTPDDFCRRLTEILEQAKEHIKQVR